MKKLIVFLSALIVLLMAGACAETEITTVTQLNAPGMTVGVGQGSAAEDAVMKELPEAGIAYFTDNLLAYTAVAQGKVDAYIYDLVQMQLTIDNGLKGVHLLPETMNETVKIAVGISGVSKIPELMKKTNAFIAEMKANGTLDDMYRRWVLEGDRAMPQISVPESADIHLTVGTTGNVPPYSYYEGSGLTGYDIELARRYAAWLGAELSFQVIDFDGVVAAAQSGKVDVIMSNLQYLPERSEGLPFSDILYEEKLGVLVRGDSNAAPGTVIGSPEKAESESAPAWQAYNGKRIGVQTGTAFDEIVLETLPNAKISYYNSYPDMAAAVEAHKIDGFIGDEPALQLMAEEDPQLSILSESMDSFDFGFVLPKTEAGKALRTELDAWIASMQESGELEKTIRKWTEGKEAEKTIPDYAAFPAAKGTLRMATEGAYAPMNYYRENEVVGMEIDLAARFCQDKGYGLSVEAMNFDGILPAVQAGKADFAAAGISITEERKESVYFSAPYYTGGTVLAVLKAEEPAAVVSAADDMTRKGSSWDGLKDSFNKTFLREDRWRLFLEGIGTTMLITLLSTLLGTALGFLVFMLCRNGNMVANGVTRFCVWLVTGTPMVVLLMILYYIIFGNVAISGIAVAVIGFTLTFGAAVYGLLRMGVGTIDRGQYEAAYALGHSNRHTFFRIILPQAVPRVLPAYQGEIVGLIKATAIVGYIAVQDLTKMGDIVRSRTYEAFFPLIAVTVIYFVLEGLLSFAVSRVRVSIDPKKRKREKILKGVKTDD